MHKGLSKTSNDQRLGMNLVVRLQAIHQCNNVWTACLVPEGR